jgi:glyoxylase-like metal-dependent hydrolase (beta-lactamase superfamily II)
MGKGRVSALLDRLGGHTRLSLGPPTTKRGLLLCLAVGACCAATLQSPADAQTSGPLTAATSQTDSDIVVPAPRKVAAGVWLISGALRPMREPDGNTVIFEGPSGLIVVDTGRHLAQRVAIKTFAEQRHLDIVAIINSHWHLDHVSGNRYLKTAYPRARVYASRAIEKALPGFLAQSAADSRQYLQSADAPSQMKEDIRGDLATVADSTALRPDVAIEASRRVRLAGRVVNLNLAPNAATDGDVWVYDRASGVAAVGDLVTMPSPFLDTACPLGWETALARISETPFKILVPGHGEPMTRAQFETYRAAFSALVDCSNSSRTKVECASDWSTATAGLRGAGARDLRLAQGMTEYYVADVLRAHGGKSATCATA